MSDDEDFCDHPNGFGVYGCSCGATYQSVLDREEEENMAALFHCKVVSTRYEWVVPAPEPHGAYWGEMSAAIGKARSACVSSSVSDSSIRVHSRDGEIVVSFTVESRTEL